MTITIQEQNRLIIQRFNREFLQGGDEHVFHETVAEDFVNHTRRIRRMHALTAPCFFTKVLGVAFPDLEVAIHDQVAEDDEVVTRKSYQATYLAPSGGIPQVGLRVEFTIIDVIRLRGGKYVEHWANADMAGLMRQLTATAD